MKSYLGGTDSLSAAARPTSKSPERSGSKSGSFGGTDSSAETEISVSALVPLETYIKLFSL